MATAAMTGRIGHKPAQAFRVAGTVMVVAVLLSITAFANRLPVLFPDTIGYNRTGEAAFGAVERIIGVRSPQLAVTGAMATQPVDDGVSGARSPYYGVVLALANRIGGVWFSAALQAAFAATALLLALRRFGLMHSRAGWIAGIGAGLAGLGFFAVTLVPDVFLGTMVVGCAVLLTMRDLPRGERWFWVVTVLAGMLFHRGFVTVAAVMLIAVLPWCRARWLSRRGLVIVSTCCLAAAGGHLAVGVAVEKLLHQQMVTPPFVLARMADSHVLLAYLDETCPQRHFMLCRYRNKLPTAPNTFLWWHGPAGIYANLDRNEKMLLNLEATTIVLGAVAARPTAAAAEAARLSLAQLGYAGMTDFAMKIDDTAAIDQSIIPEMDNYHDSGIVRGDFPLKRLSLWTRALYWIALAAAAVGACGVVTAWRRGERINYRIMAATALVIGAITVNAVISATLSGVNDRYQGRVAWLMIFAATVLCSHALAFRANRQWIARSLVTNRTSSPI